jgi:hypothetical protein
MPRRLCASAMMLPYDRRGTLRLPVIVVCLALGSGSVQSRTTDRATVDQSTFVKLPAPDGHWVLVTAKPRTEDGNWHLVLQRSDTKGRLSLCDYFRSGTVAWSPDSQIIVFVDDHSVQDSRLKIFRVGKDSARPLDGADRALRTIAIAGIPRNREILFYNIRLIGFLGPSGVLVEVSVEYMKGQGPTGPAAGARAQYLLDLETLNVSRK